MILLIIRLSQLCTFGDEKFHDIKGKGVIAVNSKGGNSKLIHDVLYVPGLTSNLLSVGQLLQKNYSVNFDRGESNTLFSDNLKQKRN